jgi:hypothetical protein
VIKRPVPIPPAFTVVPQISFSPANTLRFKARRKDEETALCSHPPAQFFISLGDAIAGGLRTDERHDLADRKP